MKLYRSLLAIPAILIAFAATHAEARVGPPGGMIYANDKLFETVATSNDLPNEGDFDILVQFGGGLASVADAGPGDPGFRGGRWEVHAATFLSIAPRQFTNMPDLLSAIGRGEVAIGPVLRRFECTLNPVNTR